MGLCVEYVRSERGTVCSMCTECAVDEVYISAVERRVLYAAIAVRTRCYEGRFERRCEFGQDKVVNVVSACANVCTHCVAVRDHDQWWSASAPGKRCCLFSAGRGILSYATTDAG